MVRINDPYYAGPAYDEPTPAQLREMYNIRLNAEAEAIIKHEMQRALYRINAAVNESAPEVLWDGHFIETGVSVIDARPFTRRACPEDIVDVLTECLADYIDRLPEDVDES